MVQVPTLPPTSKLRRFRNYVRLVWRHLGLPEPTPLQLDICDWIQDGPSKSVTQAFRGIGKSYITAAYATWLLLLNPQELILVVSAGKDRADMFTKFTRRLIDELPLLQHLQPNPARGDMDSAVSFQVGCCTPAQSPSVTSRGITGQLTGLRASTVILDDIEVPNNSGTPMLREKLVSRTEEVSAILIPSTKTLKAKVRVLGTPQTEQTVYKVLEERGYNTRIWPICIPTETQRLSYGDRLAPFVSNLAGAPGDPTEPSRFSAVEIGSRRMEYGKSSFALQFMLDTSLSDAERYPLKIRDLIFDTFDVKGAREIYVHSNHPRTKLVHVENVGLDGDGFYCPGDVYGEVVPFESTVLAVDPSGRGVDETAICGMSAHSGYLFAHSVFGLTGGYEDHVLEFIAREAKRIRANTILVESNFGDGMFAKLLRPVLARIYPCHIEEVKQSTMKEARIIDTLEPIMGGHRLIFHTSVIDQDSRERPDEVAERRRARQLFHQMTRISKERGCLMHDDRLDAVAIAAKYLGETMARNAYAEARSRSSYDDEPSAPESWLRQSDGMSPLFPTY